MVTAFDIAACLIELAQSEEEPEFISHLRLQKLLYYVQGWSLALRDKPMFSNEIQAWANGPVVPAVYRRLKGRGSDPITKADIVGAKPLDDEDSRFVQEVWEAYKGYSAFSLRQMTHKETPWMEARKGLKPTDLGDTVITQSSMKKFFSRSNKS